jgi:hypothetical protein
MHLSLKQRELLQCWYSVVKISVSTDILQFFNKLNSLLPWKCINEVLFFAELKPSKERVKFTAVYCKIIVVVVVVSSSIVAVCCCG